MGRESEWVGSKYDGRRAEPPYECPACAEKDEQIANLTGLARALRDELRLWHEPLACHRSDVCTTDALLAMPDVRAL